MHDIFIEIDQLKSKTVPKYNDRFSLKINFINSHLVSVQYFHHQLFELYQNVTNHSHRINISFVFSRSFKYHIIIYFTMFFTWISIINMFNTKFLIQHVLMVDQQNLKLNYLIVMDIHTHHIHIHLILAY